MTIAFSLPPVSLSLHGSKAILMKPAFIQKAIVLDTLNLFRCPIQVAEVVISVAVSRDIGTTVYTC